MLVDTHIYHKCTQNTSISTYLFHLKANGGLKFIYLHHQVVGVSQHGGKLASLAQSRAKETRDLLYEAVRCQERIVALGWWGV